MHLIIADAMVSFSKPSDMIEEANCAIVSVCPFFAASFRLAQLSLN